MSESSFDAVAFSFERKVSENLVGWGHIRPNNKLILKIKLDSYYESLAVKVDLQSMHPFILCQFSNSVLQKGWSLYQLPLGKKQGKASLFV